MPIIPVDMLQISNATNTPAIDGDEVPAEPDEPPDHRDSRSRPSLITTRSSTLPPPAYAKTKTISVDGKKPESLLTRALLSSPELTPVEPSPANLQPITELSGLTNSSAVSNRSLPSTAELTSDSETTSPLRSNTPSPPLQYNRLPRIDNHGNIHKGSADVGELQVEASLGRKRCITFACGGRLLEEEKKASSEPMKETPKVEPPKRKSALTFVCPVRPSGSDGEVQKDGAASRRILPGSRGSRSPAPPTLRKASQVSIVPSEQKSLYAEASPEKTSSIIQEKAKDTLELSDAVRYHEFGSESDEDDWMNQVTDYERKITMNDCMRKEIAIRKLGEEVEEEDRQAEDNDNEDEDEEDDDDDDDNNDDDDVDVDVDVDEDGDDGDDESTVQDGDEPDDGNESDNEAGFASSDESDDSGEYGFWTPKVASGGATDQHGLSRGISRRDSNTSVESHSQRRSKPIKLPKFRPGTPTLPDSTDFVCGTLDEDRPLEAAYISCMEERRRSKHIPIPQDIDPSFPTSDPEDEDDDNLEGGSATSARPHGRGSGPFQGFDEECLRGRSKGPASRTSPNHSPKRLQSPPPRRLFGRSPKRLRSPPPARLRSPPPTRRTSVTQASGSGACRVHFTGLAQRPHRIRTSSLPRTPNPYFARLAQHRLSSRTSSSSPVRASRRRNKHTRGPIDIVAGLEKKREKRKEKFWRQHCRKAAKEQLERKRPLCGKGAERMRELGLEVAERFKAYNVIQDAQLVLSV
ncbi:hypothetical protein CPC735_069730 [Coccidioides posadasii C735 delta SOWgp]|uniref:Uncharacterized protein n=2 Tax=Coccidioides posadasii TaxID=199306 RepID=C5P0T3_COCP7|nr:hypothetical protein CPC735_069730 [Coccidioides posadasii C735 delta SOWgp]EER29291.1 hypothetical protein CPC735_069730 [Coccidioides posadasii C735 delta SOWgp]|eukprot:XP_003071436.1 hypothetical protein CPC735_069730 [Coccidioides posadasii C735 delta SOWgp]